jgi:hypothetical protein
MTNRKNKSKELPVIRAGYMLSGVCWVCGTHRNCGHHFEAVKSFFLGGGLEDKRGSLVIVNSSGNLTWMCDSCWNKIKTVLLPGKKNSQEDDM